MASTNPMEEAQSLYERIVDEAITEERLPTGRYNQQGNIDLMQSIIRGAPKTAQIVIQMLAHACEDPNNTNRDVSELHGIWLVVAYLTEYGKMEPTSLMLKKTAPSLYDSAVAAMKKQGI